MQRKNGISVNSIVLFCLIWVYYSLNAKFLNFSVLGILRWIFPVLLIGIAILAKRGYIAVPPAFVWCFTVAVLLPAVTGTNATISVMKYISWVLIFYGCYIYFCQASGTDSMHRFLHILFTVLVIYQALNFIFVLAGLGIVNGRSSGITTNANTLGVYSNLAFWAGVYWYDRENNGLKKIMWLVFLASTVYTIVASASRTAFVVLVMDVMIALVLIQKRRKSFVPVAIGLGVFTFMVLTGTLNFLDIPAIQRLSEEGGTARDELWDMAIHIWRDNKLLGVGYGLSNQFNETKGLEFHNSYLSFLVECGLWGIIILGSSLLLNILKLYTSFRKWLYEKKHWEFILVCVTLLCLGVAAWSESFLFAVGSTEGFTFWFLMAWALVYIKKQKKENKISESIEVQKV